MNAEELLAVEGVTKVYRMGEVEVHALRGIDLKLRSRVLRLADGRLVADDRNQTRSSPQQLSW